VVVLPPSRRLQFRAAANWRLLPRHRIETVAVATIPIYDLTFFLEGYNFLII